MKTTTEIYRYFQGALAYPGLPDPPIILDDCALDSRFQGKDWVFLAYRGSRADGNDFREQAINNGAALILSDRRGVATAIKGIPVWHVPNLSRHISAFCSWFYDHPGHSLAISAITGTNGKTSTSHFCAQLLAQGSRSIGLLGTLGNGLWPRLHHARTTTADPATLHRVLATCRDSGAEAAVLEASSHAIVQGRLAHVPVQYALWTNLSHDHLDYHGSLEAYYQAKRQLFQSPALQEAIINYDDPHGQRLLGDTALPDTVHRLSYSLKNPEADLFVDQIEPIASGFCCTLCYQHSRQAVQVPLLGFFNLANFAAACLCALRYGISLTRIAQLAPRLAPVCGRMQQLDFPGLPKVIIDFAHSPDALEKCLQALRHHFSGRLWCLFGCGGDRDPAKRPLMGAVAERYADRIILTEDNSRFERTEAIIAAIQTGMQAPRRARIIPDRQQAIARLLEHAERQDMVLLAGKGHERSIERHGQFSHFDEPAIIRQYYERGYL